LAVFGLFSRKRALLLSFFFHSAILKDAFSLLELLQNRFQNGPRFVHIGAQNSTQRFEVSAGHRTPRPLVVQESLVRTDLRERVGRGALIEVVRVVLIRRRFQFLLRHRRSGDPQKSATEVIEFDGQSTLGGTPFRELLFP
jgi:hypothetical protein